MPFWVDWDPHESYCCNVLLTKVPTLILVHDTQYLYIEWAVNLQLSPWLRETDILIWISWSNECISNNTGGGIRYLSSLELASPPYLFGSESKLPKEALDYFWMSNLGFLRGKVCRSAAINAFSPWQFHFSTKDQHWHLSHSFAFYTFKDCGASSLEFECSHMDICWTSKAKTQTRKHSDLLWYHTLRDQQCSYNGFAVTWCINTLWFILRRNGIYLESQRQKLLEIL